MLVSPEPRVDASRAQRGSPQLVAELRTVAAVRAEELVVTKEHGCAGPGWSASFSANPRTLRVLEARGRRRPVVEGLSSCQSSFSSENQAGPVVLREPRVL